MLMFQWKDLCHTKDRAEERLFKITLDHLLDGVLIHRCGLGHEVLAQGDAEGFQLAGEILPFHLEKCL
jgi:hypothetical protein